jgi:hypothetical protein
VHDPPELEPGLSLGGGDGVARVLMGHPANEAVIVDLISQWAAIALHRLANHLQMGPTALPRHQQRPDHPPGVIILGQEEVLLAPSAGSQQCREASCWKRMPGPGISKRT